MYSCISQLGSAGIIKVPGNASALYVFGKGFLLLAQNSDTLNGESLGAIASAGIWNLGIVLIAQRNLAAEQMMCCRHDFDILKYVSNINTLTYRNMCL